MAAFDTFKYCSNFSDVQTKVIALVRGVSAAVCFAILSTVLVVLVILAIPPKDKKSTVWNCCKAALIWTHCSQCALPT